MSDPLTEPGFWRERLYVLAEAWGDQFLANYTAGEDGDRLALDARWAYSYVLDAERARELPVPEVDENYLWGV